MSKPYYTLLTRDGVCDPWAITFGDYSKEVVEQELSDMRDSDLTMKRDNAKIIKTGDKQADIVAAVAKLNEA